MKQGATKFIAGAFALIALFLVLSHFTGFAQDVGALSGGSSKVFTTLQGRG